MKDILLNNESDLLITSGDLVIGESTLQHQQLLLIANKGDFKESPTVSVGVKMWLKDSEEAGGLLGEIKKEFERDGMTVKSVAINPEGKLDIDAGY